MAPKPLHPHLGPASLIPAPSFYPCIPAALLTLLPFSHPKHRKRIRAVPLAAPLAWNTPSLAFLCDWLLLII